MLNLMHNKRDANLNYMDTSASSCDRLTCIRPITLWGIIRKTGWNFTKTNCLKILKSYQGATIPGRRKAWRVEPAFWPGSTSEAHSSSQAGTEKGFRQFQGTEEMKIGVQGLFIHHGHSSIIYNSPKVEITQVCPLDKRINSVVGTHNKILFILKKEGSSDTGYNMDKP